MENVCFAGGKLNGDDAIALAVFDQQIDHLELIEERDVVLDAVLIERLKDHVASAVGGVARAHDCLLRIVVSVTTEAALADLALGRAVEGQTHVLKVNDGPDGFLAHEIDCVLIG